jgi:hypothetical protein
MWSTRQRCPRRNPHGADLCGGALLTWRADSFAYAESYDEAASRYRGLKANQNVIIGPDDSGLLVKPGVAARQLDAETATSPEPPRRPEEREKEDPSQFNEEGRGRAKDAPKPYRRFHGTVRIDSARVGRDAGRIAEEVIAHLAGQVGAEVTVALEIEAWLPNGASEALVRTVTENSRTLKFDSQGFEKD